MANLLQTVSYERIKEKLNKKDWNDQVVRAHIVDNPQSLEDVKKAKENYAHFLQTFYSELKDLSNEEIYALTRQELYWDILHPEKRMELTNMIMETKQLSSIEELNQKIKIRKLS